MIAVRVRVVTAAVTAAVLSAGFGVAQSGPPSSQTGGAAVTTLEQRAIEQGRVRVIIGLRTDFLPEGLLNAGERTQQREEIARAQAAVLTDLAALGPAAVKTFHIVPGMAMDVDFATLQRLRAHPLIANIEEDALAAPALAESAVLIGAPAVWSSGYAGTGQAVAILDSGVERTHPFLGGRIVAEACYSTTSPASGSTALCTSGSTATGAGAPCPAISGCEHGTHVAGIAAGSGASFHGVARNANLIAIQVFSRFDGSSCGSSSPCIKAFTSDIVLGLERVHVLRESHSIAAANLSLGGAPFTDQAQCDAANASNGMKAIIDTLSLEGTATVIASGNDGYTNAVSSPACISTAVSVGSTTDGSFDATPADAISAFTNSASFLNLLAPGHWITSSVPGAGFSTFAGTSMAAPQVAGAWAVLKSRYAFASVTQILNALTTTGVGVFDPGNGLTKPRIRLPDAMNALASTCTFALNPTSAIVPAGVASGIVSVSTEPGCLWTATSHASFITIVGDSSGIGPGTLSYSVTANASASPRSGTLAIAGHTFDLTQQGASGGVRLDLNGDGMLDLVWQHQGDGRISTWLMNGTNLIAGILLSPSQVPDTNWKIAGTGDLDGDGQTDLVWQNIADGRVSGWLMNGLEARESALFSIPQVADTAWRIRAVGDVNGDGKADLLWQNHDDGRISSWLMDGLNVAAFIVFNPSSVADLDWVIVGAADFDGNGSRDLVWHHQTDGRIGVWLMNGTSLMSGSLSNPGQVPDLAWKIRGVGDLNNDGHPDFIWQNTVDGRISVWLMNGLDLIEGRLLNPSAVPDTGWHVVGPR